MMAAVAHLHARWRRDGLGLQADDCARLRVARPGVGLGGEPELGAAARVLPVAVEVPHAEVPLHQPHSQLQARNRNNRQLNEGGTATEEEAQHRTMGIETEGLV